MDANHHHHFSFNMSLKKIGANVFLHDITKAYEGHHPYFFRGIAGEVVWTPCCHYHRHCVCAANDFHLRVHENEIPAILVGARRRSRAMSSHVPLPHLKSAPTTDLGPSRAPAPPPQLADAENGERVDKPTPPGWPALGSSAAHLF